MISGGGHPKRAPASRGRSKAGSASPAKAASRPRARKTAAGAGRSPDGQTFSDVSTPVADLKELVRQFIHERQWGGYHTPKNVAISVVLEAAELLEHFQWTPGDPAGLRPEQRHEIGEEMADVLAYLLSLANVLQIDLAAALAAKMLKNGEKYPSARFQGTWEKVRLPRGGKP